MLLANHTAVVTGNPYGIGRETARLLSEQGADVICIDDSVEGWETPNDSDGECTPRFIVDASDTAAMAAVADECGRLIDGLDILINLAGRAMPATFESTTSDIWERMIARNLSAAYICTLEFLPLMKKRRQGSIINHSSIDGMLGNPGLAAYSAAKGGVLPLTHVMAHDLARYGIRVNCVSTGGIRDGNVRAKDRTLTALTPAGRTGTPLDVAQVVLFLASDWSSYVNGANIVVDGGRTVITQGCYGA